MELILNGRDSVIITLDESDLTHYGISDGLSRKGFNSILGDVSRMCGFDASGERMLVELYESRTGGCEMFITKLPPDAEGDGTDKLSCPMRQRRYVYRFASMSDLLSSCREMKNCGYAGKSAAYSDKPSGRYFLVTDEESAITSEFLARECKSAVMNYISEHCKLITDDAAGVLGVL